MAKKKTRRAALPPSPAPAATAVGRAVWLGLAAILLLAAALRCWRLDSPLGGFHAHNEANYILIAQHFFHASLLTPISSGRHVYLETPPLYSYLLYGVFRAVGISVLAARLVSVASSLGMVAATFLLGRRLFGARPALVGALLVSVSPVAVLTGRNVQTDSLLLLWIVLGLFFWERAETGGRGDRILSGVFFGLALFTKLFGLVSLLALVLWETLRRKGVGWLRDRRRWEAAGIAAALPLFFYGYHAVRDYPHLRREVAGGAAVATTFPSSLQQWGALGVEWFWAFSPFLFLLVLAGVARAAARPSPARLLLLTQFLAFLLFYLFVHKHSYYLLTLLPFGALLAGEFLEHLGRVAQTSCVAAAALTGIFFSAVDVTSMKLGFREFAELSTVARGLPAPERVYLVDASFRDNAGIIVAFCDPSARLAVLEKLAAGPDGRLLLPEKDVYLLRFVPPRAAKPPVGWLFSRERFGLTLFGWTLAEAHSNPNFFRQGRYVATRSGGLSDFGASLLGVYPALVLVPIPPELALYRTEKGIVLTPPENR